MLRRLSGLAAMGLVASIPLASATVIKQTVSQATSHTDWSTNFTLNDFDAGLGTLTSVKAMLSDRWSTAGTVRNKASGSNSFTFGESTTISESGGPRESGVLTNTFDGNTPSNTPPLQPELPSHTDHSPGLFHRPIVPSPPTSLPLKCPAPLL
jgi:hypothetical protein